MKIYKDINVYDATIERLKYTFENFDNICVSLSGGKDSSVMIQLTQKVSEIYGKKYDVLFIDMEAQYLLTLEHINELKSLKNIREFYHVALPLSLRNAVSIFEPRWLCWEKEVKEKWVRPLPIDSINEDNNIFEFYKYAMEFEEFVPEFTKWYSKKHNNSMCASLVGIRSDESLNRFRTIISEKKDRLNGLGWTTRNKPLENSYSVFPIYDWRTEDIWTCVSKLDLSYNYVYELMYKNGLGIHQQRLCQPFGDDQKNGLDQYKAIESQNWERLLMRVSGVNFGNIYCRTSALGNIKSIKPEHLSWEEWSMYLLESIGIYNPDLEKHYRNRIKKFFKYWEEKCGYPIEEVKDFEDSKLESSKKVPSWRRVARALERNDFFMSRLSFGQTKSDAEYLKKMVSKWDNLLEEQNTDSKPLKRLFKEIKENNGNKD